MIKLVNQDQTKNIKEFMKDKKNFNTVIADAPVQIELDTLAFYNELVTGEKGKLESLGATMKVAFQLFQSKDTIDLTSKGFVDNDELNATTLEWIKTDGLEYLNQGYQLAELKGDNPFKDYATTQKERPELIRVLRDALPVACFLIDSDSPYSSDGDYFTKPQTTRALLMYINSKKLIKTDMQKKFNADGDTKVNCTFSDLQSMASFWFFNKERPTSKTSFESANEKIAKALTTGVGTDGKIKAKDIEQLNSTLNSNVKVIKEYLNLFDNHNRGDLITKVVEHIQQLTWFNTHCLPKMDIKLFGLVHKDAIQINHVTNAKKVAIKK